MQKIESFINDLFDTMKMVSDDDLSTAARLLAHPTATGRNRWIQLVRCAAIIGNHARTIEVVPELAFRIVPTMRGGGGFKVQRMHNGEWIETAAALIPYAVGPFPTIEAAETAILEYGRDTHTAVTLLRDDGSIARASPGDDAFPSVQIADVPAALVGETPSTIRELMTGAFRVVSSKNGFAINRWRAAAEHGFDHWSGIIDECGEPLWPWREHPTVETAEAAILEYGRKVGEAVTLVRNDGSLATAAPGTPSFPRLVNPILLRLVKGEGCLIVEAKGPYEGDWRVVAKEAGGYNAARYAGEAYVNRRRDGATFIWVTETPSDFNERCRAIVGWKRDGLAAAALRTVVRQLQLAGWTQDAIENGLKGQPPSLPPVGPEYVAGLAGNQHLQYRLDRVADMLEQLREKQNEIQGVDFPTQLRIIDEAIGIVRCKIPITIRIRDEMSDPLVIATEAVEQLAAAYNDLTPPADRLAETVKIGWPETLLTPVSLPDESSIPDQPGTYKIKPTIGGNAWNVWVYTPEDGWIRTIGAIENYATYWDATDAIVEIAKLKPDQPTYVVTPSAADLARWSARRITIDQPAPSIETTDDTVMITGTPQQVTDTGREILAGLMDEVGPALNVLPVVEIGTKVPVPIGDDLWKVAEWTAGGLITVRDELTWDEVSAFLNPPAAATGDPVGKIEIIPATEQPGMFDVRQWTGTKWKKIGGNVTQRTAQGIVDARMRDPENQIVKDVSNAPRKAISKARVRIEGLIGSIKQRDENKTVTDEWIIERLTNLLDVLKVD